MTRRKAPRQPLRAGALTLLLAVVLLGLAVLAVLSLTTARADLALAQKQQQLVQLNAKAECAGQQLLAAMDEGAALPAGAQRAAGGTVQAMLQIDDTHTLAITVTANGAVQRWQLITEWQTEDSLNVWGG